MLDDLISIFEKANSNFIVKDINLFDIKVSERTLCGALMLWLQEELKHSCFAQYYVDVEFNRNKNGAIKTIISDQYKIIRINCDLIVHGRGHIQGKENLIAIEMKKSSQKLDSKNVDRDRLMVLTRETYQDVWAWEGSDPKHVCGYGLGIYYEINYRKRNILLEYYAKGKMIKNKNFGF